MGCYLIDNDETQVWESEGGRPEPIRKTFLEWNNELINDKNAPFYVLDPDGFDRRAPDFYERLYTWEDFEQRALWSTCMFRDKEI